MFCHLLQNAEDAIGESSVPLFLTLPIRRHRAEPETMSPRTPKRRAVGICLVPRLVALVSCEVTHLRLLSPSDEVLRFTLRPN